MKQIEKTSTFDFAQYCEYIFKKEFDKAEKYKIMNVPKTLYKYMGFSNDDNSKKLNSINKKRIWLSSYKKLNDPFEQNSIFYNESIIRKHGWNPKQINSILEDFQKTFICSLTENDYNNMPMWAHYANNHNGICVKYIVNDAINVYPVSYEPERQKCDSIITNLYSNLIDYYNGDKSKELGIKQSIYTLKNISYMKDERWHHEKEWRIISWDRTSDCEGYDVNNSGLEISDIFMGLNCKPECKEKLKNIAKNINCNLHQMKMDDESKDFRLSYNTIIKNTNIIDI